MEQMTQNVGVSDKVVNIDTVKSTKKTSVKVTKIKVYESDVINACLRWLLQRDCFVWRHNTGTGEAAGGGYIRFGAKGSPDIVGMNPAGRFLGVECKGIGTNAKHSDDQIAFGKKITDSGGIYIVSTGVDDLEANKAEILGQKNLPTA